MIGDGQVTMGAEVVKPNVKKVRRIGTGVIGGFAGACPVCRRRSERRWRDATRAAAPLAHEALLAPAATLPRPRSARVCGCRRMQLRLRA
jgi:hypothetical protein